jgi:gliding motility-associated-like protein
MLEREIAKQTYLKISSRILLILCCFAFTTSSYSQRIPVVVHIISDDPDAVSDATIINAINDLNDAFAHSGAYGFGAGANTGISFCLANKDPNGGNTNGITRTKSVLNDFDVDIEDSKTKNLISWDTKKYLNIWYATGLKSEIYQNYSCGVWRRMKEGGYATFSSGGDYRDGVVVTAFGVMLAHEVGHYLGLRHTFIPENCYNSDCSVDGDGICDTPPQQVFSGSCISPQNSCSTDTLSGFATDQPDLNENFMGYSPCANMFTNGQATKMKDVLATVRGSLLVEDLCAKPCAENIVASFTRNNWFPVAGDVINFTSTSTGGSNYEWTIDGVPAGSNSATLTHSFSALGKYQVTLKVYNASKSCYAAYSHNVIVTCGVMARFYPDKRIIASKAPIMLDTIVFTNRSVNGVSYQWLMANDTGMVETVVSTGKDLTYIFVNKGNYRVRLIATNGSCSDTTSTFFFRVEDPAFDGNVNIVDVHCFQETKLKFAMYICNNGYAPIPKGVPISFYDGDPRLPGAIKLDTTFLLPDSVKGKCCGKFYFLVIDVKKAKFNTLYAAFNDSGIVLPLTFPTTPLDELNYRNNVAIVSGFKYTASIVPSTATLEPGDTLRLVGRGLPSPTVTYKWKAFPELSCTNCPKPLFTAQKTDVKLELITVSSYGCTDTGYADIKVPPAEDLTIKIDTVHCYKNDSLLVNFEICNAFKRGLVPKDVKVSFYDADPGSGGKPMGPPFVVPSNSAGLCQKYSYKVKGKGPIRLYAVVNDKGVVPFAMPNDTVLIEKNYTNNTTSYDHKVETVSIIPPDTAIIRKTSVGLSILSTIYDPSSVTWNNGPGYVLSCSKCLTPSVTVNTDSKVTMQMSSLYGCTIQGEARIKILPPDFTIKITGTECYSNTKTLVKYRICMNNGYDTVFRNIPVSFYGSDPNSGSASPLDSVFYTPGPRPGACDSFISIVNTPSGDYIYAAVNDKGGSGFPNQLYPETDPRNNTDRARFERFIVKIVPDDTTIYRNTTVQLKASATGGKITSYTWSPAVPLSCVNCLDPVVRAPYSQEILFSARNQNTCTSTDTAFIKTYSEGPVNIPNAFTPNGDGKNDVFYIIGSRDIQVLKEFSIYDRYGQKIFQVKNVPPNNPTYGWRGRTGSGTELPQGSYAYAVTVVFNDGREQLFKGTITLIR